jgi:D-ribulokinase
MKALIGIDVGTGSARAGVFGLDGHMLASAKRPITLWHQPGDIVEQSSDQIWQAICEAVREAMSSSGIATESVSGIGFDATCSLVALDPTGGGVAVGPSNDPQRNVIVWMDHRAQAESEEINQGGYRVLDYVGGRISPEMETPKLLWLSRHRPESFASAAHFFDLSDYLTWRATGSLDRSVCTVTCKWTYLAHEDRWDPDYFRQVGLGTLAEEGFRRIGTKVVAPGTRLGGLTEAAAAEMGLAPSTPVAASLIDAHAGGLGTLGVSAAHQPADLGKRLAYIFGTSACSMASTTDPVFVPGVWGPYFNSMIPGIWLLEGGQSAAGAALDRLVQLHPDAPMLEAEAARQGQSLLAYVAAHALTLGPTLSETILAARDMVVVPEFNGNRSPFADPEARAIISGLSFDRGLASLAALYLAGLSGIGYGLRQLLNRLRASGIEIASIVASGGAARSDLVCQMLADTTGTTVLLPEREEPVLLGSAMLGGVAGGMFPDLGAAMAAMSGSSRQFTSVTTELADLHTNRFACFEALQEANRSLRRTR